MTWSQSPGPPPRRKRSRLPAIAAVAGLVAVVAAVVLLVLPVVQEDGPEKDLDAFLSDWSKGDDRAAAQRTDQPKAALAAFTANRAGLDKARLEATRDSVSEDGDEATAKVRMEWTVPGIGLFAYGTELKLRKKGDEWQVRYAPTMIHPDLDRASRLGTTREPARRGAIRDRNGAALVTARPVIRVGVVAGQVKRPRQTAAQIDDIVDIDAGALVKAIRGAGPQQFVPAVTLREEDAKPLESRL